MARSAGSFRLITRDGGPCPPIPFIRIAREHQLKNSTGGLYMNRLLVTLAITATAGGLLSSNPLAAQVSPTTPKAASVRITQGPAPERADSYLTIIRWTTNNPGGSPEHF